MFPLPSDTGRVEDNSSEELSLKMAPVAGDEVDLFLWDAQRFPVRIEVGDFSFCPRFGGGRDAILVAGEGGLSLFSASAVPLGAWHLQHPDGGQRKACPVSLNP